MGRPAPLPHPSAVLFLHSLFPFLVESVFHAARSIHFPSYERIPGSSRLGDQSLRASEHCDTRCRGGEGTVGHVSEALQCAECEIQFLSIVEFVRRRRRSTQQRRRDSQQRRGVTVRFTACIQRQWWKWRQQQCRHQAALHHLRRRQQRCACGRGSVAPGSSGRCKICSQAGAIVRKRSSRICLSIRSEYHSTLIRSSSVPLPATRHPASHCTRGGTAAASALQQRNEGGPSMKPRSHSPDCIG